MSDFFVRKIENGTVIDHIPAGVGLRVAVILDLNNNENCFVVLANVPSTQLGKKDIVKIENKELTKKEAEKISLVAPGATVNIIRNFSVVEKKDLSLPDAFHEVVECPNTNCITNHEHAATKFMVETKQPLKIRCHYCERLFGAEEISA